MEDYRDFDIRLALNAQAPCDPLAIGAQPLLKLQPQRIIIGLLQCVRVKMHRVAQACPL